MVSSDGIIAFTLLFLLRGLHLYGDRKWQKKGCVDKPFLQYLQYGSFVFILFLATLEHSLVAHSVPVWVVYAIIFVIILTQLIKLWAHLTLGHWWSPHVELRRDQPLVKSGPYSVMRHPSYLNGILEGVLAPLLVGSWVTSILAIPIIWLIFSMRIREEEAKMQAQFGESYRQYCIDVSRFGMKFKQFGIKSSRKYANKPRCISLQAITFREY